MCDDSPAASNNTPPVTDDGSACVASGLGAAAVDVDAIAGADAVGTANGYTTHGWLESTVFGSVAWSV